MSERLYLISISLIPLTVLLVYAMRYFTAYRQTNAQLANEKAYRELAEKAVSVQTETRDKLASVEVTLAELKARITTVEAILKIVWRAGRSKCVSCLRKFHSDCPKHRGFKLAVVVGNHWRFIDARTRCAGDRTLLLPSAPCEQTLSDLGDASQYRANGSASAEQTQPRCATAFAAKPERFPRLRPRANPRANVSFHQCP
jgi:hypothetical protein